MDVTLPDGVVISGVPEGTTQTELLGRLQLAKHPSAEALMKQMASQEALNDTSGLGKFNAGMGLAFTNIGRATKQMFGLGSEYEENKGTDKALTRTGAGMAGNVAGNIAAFAPLAVVPGANTVAGAAALGGITGAFQPSDSATDRLKNMAIGTGLGASTQYLGTTGAQKIGEAAANREAAAAARQSQNAVRDQTLSEGQAAGYVIPPSAVNPSNVNKAVESVAGKAAVGQEASLRNQETTNRLARAAAGLAPDEALSEAALKGSRSRAAEPYREVSSLNAQAAADLDGVKTAQREAKLQWTFYNRSGDPAAFKAATAASQEAERLLNNIDAAAQASGKPELVKALKEARVQIAKIHDVERAVNVGTGGVDASVLGRALDRGAPLTDELRTIGSFQQAFPSYTREGSAIPTPGVSKVAALSSALLGGGGAAAAGPVGAAAGALPFVAPPLARSAVLSKPYQSMMAAPDYSVSAATKAAAALADPETRRRVALLARSLALPAIPYATPASE